MMITENWHQHFYCLHPTTLQLLKIREPDSVSCFAWSVFTIIRWCNFRNSWEKHKQILPPPPHSPSKVEKFRNQLKFCNQILERHNFVHLIKLFKHFKLRREENTFKVARGWILAKYVDCTGWTIFYSGHYLTQFAPFRFMKFYVFYYCYDAT